MSSKSLFTCAVFIALTALFCMSAAAQHRPPIEIPIQQNGAVPVGTEEPCIANMCLFYAGDFDANGPNPNGLWNENASFFGLTIDGTVWVPFTVPKKFKGAKGKTDWNVTGLFVNDQNFPSPSATQATWSIVQGVAAGGNPTGRQVKVLCSGTAPVTATPTGRIAFGFYTEYTYVASGVSCPTLENGTYLMTTVVQVPAPPSGFEDNFLSDVEDNTPANAVGPGISVEDDSFFVSAFFGFPNFTLANLTSICGNIGCDNFSVGVIGTAIH